MAKRILIVDDSATVRQQHSALLRQGDFEVLLARDGAEGLEMALAEHPDLILMDVVMPRMDGYDACKALRERPETADIPIIMITTKAELDFVEIGYTSGCNDYITKPVDPTEFLAKVESWVNVSA